MEGGAASGTSSCSLSQTGYRFCGSYRRADSPMSMTSPRTTLTRGHCAPLPNRSSAAPLSTLPHGTKFLRRDLRQRADYFALSPIVARDGLRPPVNSNVGRQDGVAYTFDP